MLWYAVERDIFFVLLNFHQGTRICYLSLSNEAHEVNELVASAVVDADDALTAQCQCVQRDWHVILGVATDHQQTTLQTSSHTIITPLSHHYQDCSVRNILIQFYQMKNNGRVLFWGNSLIILIEQNSVKMIF